MALVHLSGDVAAQDDRDPVLGHAVQVAGGDESVHRVDRGRLHPHQQLPGTGLGLGQVVPEAGRSVEAVQGEGTHQTGSFSAVSLWGA